MRCVVFAAALVAPAPAPAPAPVSPLAFDLTLGPQLASDMYETFNVADLCKSFISRESLGRTSRRALGSLDPNSLPRRPSLTPSKKAVDENTYVSTRLPLLVAHDDRSDCADRGPARSHLNDDLLRHESLLCHERLTFDELQPGEEEKSAPPVQAIEALSPETLPEQLLAMSDCTEEALQFLYSEITSKVVVPCITASWFGSKGNCRGWEMLRFQEQARIGRRKLLVLQSDTPVSLSVLIMREGVPLHDLGSSELHLERVNVEKHVSDCMGSGIPAEKDLSKCALGLEVHLGPNEPEARILLHCERLGKDRRRDGYTVIVLDNNRSGAVVCSWNCHVYNLKYESMNKKSKFVPTALGAAPCHFQLKGDLWTQAAAGPAGDLAQ